MNTRDDLIGYALGAIFWIGLGMILILFPKQFRNWELKNSSWFKGFKRAAFYPASLRIMGVFFVGIGILYIFVLFKAM